MFRTELTRKLLCRTGWFILLLAVDVLGEHDSITVIGQQSNQNLALKGLTAAANDAAALMQYVPGGSVNMNGPLSGLPQYRGMFGPRLGFRVNKMHIAPAGPVWMDPPLHYVPMPLLETIVVRRGTVSVSDGIGIGGFIDARSKTSEFTDNEEFTAQGSSVLMGHSSDDGYNGGLIWGLSNRQHRFHLFAARDDGNDTKAGDDINVAASEYQRDTFGLGYGIRLGQHDLALNYQRTNTGDSGVPVLPLDIDFYHADLGSLSYTTSWGGYDVDLLFARKEIEHRMSNFNLRSATDFDLLPVDDDEKLPPFRGIDRRYAETATDGSNIFLKLSRSLMRGSVEFGIENYSDDHAMTIFDPDVAPFYIDNLSGISVDRLSLFGEWSGELMRRWGSTIGARYTRVHTSSEQVDAFPADLADRGVDNPLTESVRRLRDRFNAADRSNYDNNLDVVLGFDYRFNDQAEMLINISRKTRSPDYVERYLWIPLEANSGLGDGSNYVGSPDLAAEVSHELEIGFNWRSDAAYFSPYIYHRWIDNYIQGVAATDPDIVAVSRANGDYSPKQFANVDAKIYGIDAEFGYQFNADWRMDGLFSLVRGQRRDVDDNLFRIMPPRLAFTLARTFDYGHIGLETILVDEQSHLARLLLDADNLGGRMDTGVTPGYALLNLHLEYRLPGQQNILLAGGIDNVLDHLYRDHVAGFNRVSDSDVALGEKLPGRGRNFYFNLQYGW